MSTGFDTSHQCESKTIYIIAHICLCSCNKKELTLNHFYYHNPAAVFGEPHFITFDGTKYTFNGYGEFMLMTAPESNVFIHGRMAQMIDNGKSHKNIINQYFA